MKHKGCFFAGVAYFSLVSLIPVVSATQDSPHPVFDVTEEKYRAPIDLTSESLEDLLALKEFYLREMKILMQAVETKTDQKKLFDALLEYDLKRLEIIQVIPKIVRVYGIRGELMQSLFKYRETIQHIYDDYHPQLETLEDYKAYDFRIGMAYASMFATIMNTDHELYQRLRNDMTNKTTTIGDYVESLDQSYINVERVNSEVREFHLVRQIDKELERINQEIEER